MMQLATNLVCIHKLRKYGTADVQSDKEPVGLGGGVFGGGSGRVLRDHMAYRETRGGISHRSLSIK